MTRKPTEETNAPRAQVVPVDLTNEMIVLAAGMVDAAARAKLSSTVNADLFFDDGHSAAWAALAELQRRGMGVDIPALAKALAGKVEASYLSELAAAYPQAPKNLDHHVHALRWDHARASAARGPLADLLKLLQDPSADPSRVRAAGKQVAVALDVSTDRSFMPDRIELARRTTEAMRLRGVRGIREFGIKGLDLYPDKKPRMLVGTELGALTVVTGVSGSNKSTFTARLVLEQARRQRPVLFGAWEMSFERTMELMAVCSLADEDPKDEQWTRTAIKIGQLDAQHMRRFQERCESIGEYVRFFHPPFHRELRKRYDNQDSLDVVCQQIQDSGAELVVFDLFDRCTPSTRPEDVERALYRLQQIAQETNTHLMPLVQQKIKEVEDTDDKMPTRRTIFGSQSWVTVADTILGVHYPRLWKPTLTESKLEILVLKQREGRWPQRIEFDWDAERVQMKNGRELRMHYDPSEVDDEKLSGSKGVSNFLKKGKTPAYERKADRPASARR